MNKEYELIGKEAERWKRRNLSRILATVIGLLSLMVFARGQTPEGCTKLPSGIILCPSPKTTPDPLGDYLKKLETRIDNTREKMANEVPADRRPDASWTYLTYTSNPNRTDIYYRDLKHRGDYAEAWLRWVPSKPLSTVAKSPLRNVAYYLQFATVDCERARITLESTILYDKRDRQIPSVFKGLMSSFNEPILRDSVGESIETELCRYAKP